MEKIVDIHKEPLDAVELMKQPGIVGYIVKKRRTIMGHCKTFSYYRGRNYGDKRTQIGRCAAGR